MRIRFREFDPFARLRRKFIRETEVALARAWEGSERMVRIPTIEVGHGAFHPRFAHEWWSQTLGLYPPSK